MIHLIVGIQGSGKSTFAKELSKKENIEIVSTDAIRKNNPGIEEYKVWEIVYKRMADLIKENKDCIFDATSITKKVRKRFFDSLKVYNVEVNADCYFLDTDVDICVERVSKRNMDENELYLPVDVIYSYNERLEIPSVDEGFNKIIVIKNYTNE